MYCFDLNKVFKDYDLEIIYGNEFLSNQLDDIFVLQNLPEKDMETEIINLSEKPHIFIFMTYGVDIHKVFNIIVKNNVLSISGMAGINKEDINISEQEKKNIYFPVLQLKNTRNFSSMLFNIYNFIEKKFRDEIDDKKIIDSLIYDTDRNIDYFVARAKVYGYDIEKPHFAFAFKIYIDNNERRCKMREIIQNSCNMFRRYIPDILCTEFSNGCLLLLPDNIKIEEIQRVINEIKAQFPWITYYGGVGNVYKTPKNFKKSIDECRKIVNLLSELNYGENTIKDFNYMFIYFIIFENKDRSIMTQFYNQTLMDINQYDNQNGTDLKHTLRVFLEENQNYTIASERLGIHRNTLKMRIDKIESLSGKSVEILEDRFDLCLSLYIDDIVSNKKII